MEKATDKAADALSKLNIEQERSNKLIVDGVSDRSRLVVQSERLAKATRSYNAAVRDAARAQVDFNKSGRDMTNTVATVNHSLSLLGKSARSFAYAAAAPTLVAIGGSAVTAAGALALLPAAAGAAGAAFGTLKIATLGFGDAMKNIRDPEKFAESLQSLSPNAQQAALSIRELLPQFDKLKNATQDSLFAGVAGQVQDLSKTLLPTVEKMTVGVADAFNKMFMGVTNQLMTPETQSAITNLTTNITNAFQSLAPAAAPFTKAITDIMSVGSDFLPGLAQAASDAATKFANFITEAKESGKLKQWIAEGMDILKRVGDIVLDIGRAFMALAPVAKDILPYIESAVEGIANALSEHPGLIYAVVGAFTAWKTVEGVIALTTALKSISTLLGVGLPASAVKGMKGISAALAAFKVPAWLAFLMKWGGPAMVGLQSDQKNATDVGLPEVKFDNQGRPYLPGTPHDPAGGGNVPGYSGGSGTFDRAPAYENPGDWQSQVRPNAARRDGVAPFSLGPLNGGGSSWTDMAVPVPSGDSRGGPKLPDAPVIPYDATVPGGSSPETFSEETSFLDARQKLAEKRARLAQLEKASEATEQDRLKARNDVIEAERDLQGAEIRLNDARANQFEKMTKAGDRFSKQMGEIGAQLDSDFGISKGLSGIAENITKFVANLAAAPLLGQLDAVSRANPTQGGHGLMGILGAQGVFGSQYQNNQYADQQRGRYSVSAMGPAALQPGMYGSDAALLANIQPGRYSQTGIADLTQGIGDCSSAVEDLVNILDGRPTGGRSMATGNASEWLTSRGFLPGAGGPGDFRVGFNSGHMQATLPGGTPFNWGSDASAARGGVGGTGADDPSFTSHFYRPAGTAAATAPSYAPLTASELTNPGLATPTPLPTSFGGGGLMAAGMPQAAPFTDTQYGGITPTGGSGKGGISMDGGGALGMAMQAGGMALDAMAPGAGQAAQTGIKLANRAIQFGGQVAGIGAQGLMETFLPTGGSELANNNWITRIVGGLAGAAPALPNLAGKSSQAPTQDQVSSVNPNTTQHGQGAGPGPGNSYGDINVTTQRDDGGGVGRDIAFALQAQHEAPGM